MGKYTAQYYADCAAVRSLENDIATLEELVHAREIKAEKAIAELYSARGQLDRKKIELRELERGLAEQEEDYAHS